MSRAAFKQGEYDEQSIRSERRVPVFPSFKLYDKYVVLRTLFFLSTFQSLMNKFDKLTPLPTPPEYSHNL